MMTSYWVIYIIELYLLACTLFLAGKDATSYQLKMKQDNDLSHKRIKRWHRDGMALALLVAIPCVVIAGSKWYWVMAGYALIRLSLFDIAFNAWASLPTNYLGGTAWADKLFINIFGMHGAAKKSAFFLLLLGGLQYFIYKF